MPVPLAPTVSRKYSAAVIVPPALRVITRRRDVHGVVAFAGVLASEPLVVCGPVLGKFSTAEPMTPQLPAESRARDEDGVLASLQGRQNRCGDACRARR